MRYDKLALAHIVLNADTALFAELSDGMFTNNIARNIFRMVTQYVHQFKTIPSMEALKAQIETKAPKEQLGLAIAFLDSLNKLELTLKSDEIVAGLSDGVFVNTIDKNVEQFVKAAESRDIGALKKVLGTLNAAVTFKDKAPKNAKDFVYNPEDDITVESFMPTMREKGTKFAGVSLVSAGSGVGKSIFAMQQAIYSYKQGLDVLVLNVELSESQFMSRIIAHILEIPEEIVKTTRDPDTLKSYNEAYQKFFSQPNKFKILNATLDATFVKNVIAAEKMSGLNLVVLDYIQLVENDSSEDWKFLTQFVKDLHQIALEHKVVILTPAQVNIDYKAIKNGDFQGSVTTRGARELELTSSLWMLLIQTPEEYEAGVARVATLKSRTSRKYTFIATTNFSFMRFDDLGSTV